MISKKFLLSYITIKGEFMQKYYTLETANASTLAQQTRLDIIGELDAIIQYENHIASTADPVYKNTLTDIVNEEKLHVGQLFGLLFMLDPMSKTQFEKGLNEFTQDMH